ncbi:glycosyltransferase family 2 protein [Aequorivita marina]|uniref:glycosyltransferase family 2 protein n=1 Tax=Aequorivita marina TaxID=3073654 RepID=UPI002874167B|nr:glycosyltransferase [Aequorivita sp. S2608]MDS1299087.1 glycosyltransferase [Aequorivita sp. S2608]
MSKVLISTIVPIYNSANYLKRCLDSMLAAQINGVINEIILVNDGSTDHSLEICKTYENNHKNIKVVSQENQGLSGARNTGLKEATGKYISFVDSDDTVNANYFRAIQPHLSEGYDMIHFGYNRVNNGNIQEYLPIERTFTRVEINDLLVNTSNNKVLWFVVRRIYKREFLLKHNIKFDIELRYGEDSTFMLRIFNNLESFISLNKSLYNYYDNEDSLTGQKYKLALLDKFEIQYKKRKEVKVPDVNDKLVKTDIANNYINHSLFALLNNLKNAPKGFDKLNELEKMRHSIVFQDCFQNYKYDWKRPKRSLIIKLFELKQYMLLFKILKINA